MVLESFDFSHYYTYEELVQFLHLCAENYSHLLNLEVIGQSYAGRNIWLATLTHQETGKALEKPGYWIDANTHAAEVTGSAVALYIIYHLLTHYQRDSQVTRLLDNYTVYALPRIAVDGAEKYLTTAYYLRSSIRPYPYPEEQDGLYPEDINGDGRILQMRIRDECGAWKVCEQDSRIMRPREPDEFDGTYYTVFTEGLIRNYDGYNIALAPSLEGIDFNRNYPYSWLPEGKQKGAGDYPFSEPETLAEAKFWQNHPNINGFLTYHTFAAVILRPYSNYPDDHFPYEDLEIYKLIGSCATKITGYECVSVYHQFRYHPEKFTYGAMDDYGYDHFGWFGFTVELWDAPTEAGVNKEDYRQWFRNHPVEDDLKLIKWNDEKLGGKGFINWQEFEHPQLGTVEIGGWDYKAVWHNAPAEYLPQLCEKHCRLAIAHALMSPCLAIRKTEVKPQGSNIYHLVVQLENQGFLPTYTSKKAQDCAYVKPIEVILSLPEGTMLISGKQKQEIPHLEGRANKVFNTTAQSSDYLCSIEWVIKASAGCQIHLTIKAERAGTVRTTLLLR